MRLVNVRQVVFALLVAAVPLAAMQTDLRPGNYEVTATIDMPGMQMPAQKQTQCITAGDLEKMSKGTISGQEAEKCKISNHKVEKNKITFDAECNMDGMVSTMTSEMTFATESFASVMRTKAAGQEMTIKTEGKRIGDCPK